MSYSSVSPVPFFTGKSGICVVFVATMMEHARLRARDPPIRIHLDVSFAFVYLVANANLTPDVSPTMKPHSILQQMHSYTFLQGEFLRCSVSVMWLILNPRPVEAPPYIFR